MGQIKWVNAALVTVAGFFGTQGAAQGISFDAFVQLVQVGTALEVEQALDQQPDLAQMQDKYGFTAAHTLDYAEFESKLSLLLRFGADINAVNDQGHAVLHTLIDPDYIPVVVAAGGDINLRDNQGRTPLMIHLLEPDALHFVAVLLAAGADPNARDASGKSVLSYAKAFGDADMTSLLVDAGARQ